MNVLTRPCRGAEPLESVAPLFIGEPSFADAVASIEAAEDLSLTKKRHWTTSLRQMAHYLDRPNETIPARIVAIADAVRKLHPEGLGVNAKTFVNHRANLRTALLWYNRQSRGTGRGAPIAETYRHLLAQIDDRHRRDVLSPFFRYLTALHLEPTDVSDAYVDGFVAFRRDGGFREVRLGQTRALVRCWNGAAEKTDGWPRVRLTEPPLKNGATGPKWEDFPEGLRGDIDRYCARLVAPRKNVTGKRLRACSASTIAMRRRVLIAAVRTAVAAGISLSELRSLRDVLRPDRAETIIEFYWSKDGEVPSSFTIDLASRFLTLSHEEGLGKDEIERLEEIRAALEEHRQVGLTEKNRALIRQVLQGDIWNSVVDLPPRMMAEARSDSRHGPVKAAITAELGVAIRILTFAPIRIKNLAAIQIGLNLVRPGGPGSPYLLAFPDYDVKNRVPLEFPLDPDTTAIIDEYISVYRPVLMRGRSHECLFPGASADQKLTRGLGEQISGRLWKLVGLRITPHQFRHAAAAIILRHEPGNYELVRRVLGHRNIQTTINFYVGMETLEATRRFSEMILSRSERPSPPRSQRKPGAIPWLSE